MSPLRQHKDTNIHIIGVTKGLVVFPYGSAVKNPPANAGDTGSVAGSGRSPGEGNNLLPYSCLENSMDREAGRL